MNEVTAGTLKQFFATTQLLMHDLGRVESQLGLELGAVRDAAVFQADEDYYPQLQTGIRADAAKMGGHYEVFYSLENTIRQQISEILRSEAEEWWTTEFIPG